MERRSTCQRLSHTFHGKSCRVARGVLSALLLAPVLLFGGMPTMLSAIDNASGVVLVRRGLSLAAFGLGGILRPNTWLIC